MNTSTTLFASIAIAAGLLCGPAARGGELLLDGSFATLTNIPAASFTGNAGRSGNSAASYVLTGTTTAGLGWTTDASNGLFELWTAGYKGTPAGVGNVLELDDTSTTNGTNVSQMVVSTAGGGTQGTVSFGYAARDSGTDAFTASVTDVTSGTTVFTQAFNPTNALANPINFSRSFSIVPGDSYQLNFLDQNTNGANAESAHLDEVSFMQVPEPSALCFLAGGVGLGTIAWKRRPSARRAC